MRFLLLTIITLLPTYLIRFHIGPFPTTLLEVLLLFTFLYWCGKKIFASRGRYGWSREDERRGTPAESAAPRHLRAKRRVGERVVPTKSGSEDEQDLPYPPAPWQKNPLLFPIIFFFLAATIAVFVAPDFRAALGLWRAYILEPILFFFMMTDTIRRGWPMVWRDVTIALSISALGVALPAIYQKFNPVGIPNIHWAAAETRRVTSWYGFPNAIGLYLAPIIVMLLGYSFSARRGDARRGSPIEPQQRSDAVGWGCRAAGPRAVAIIAACASLLAIFFARSEGALAALVIVGFVAGLFTQRTRLATTVIALVFIIATLTNTPWRDYVYEQIAFHGDSGKVRIQQWKETVTMLRDTSTSLGRGRPLLGAGLSGYPKTVAPYHQQKHIEIYQYPHNIILNFWSELGLLGIIAFFWLVIVFYRNNLRDIKNLKSEILNLKSVLLASMSVILIHGLVDVPYFKNDLAIFFWLLLALTPAPSPSIVKDNRA